MPQWKNDKNKDTRAVTPLAFHDRLLVAYDTLRIRAEDRGQDGLVRESDVDDAAELWTTTPWEFAEGTGRDDFVALRDAVMGRLMTESATGGPLCLEF